GACVGPGKDGTNHHRESEGTLPRSDGYQCPVDKLAPGDASTARSIGTVDIHDDAEPAGVARNGQRRRLVKRVSTGDVRHTTSQSAVVDGDRDVIVVRTVADL